MPEDLAPEDELCLLLARLQLFVEREERARELLAQPLRWDLLLERARTHEILPLVCHHLRALGWLGVPQAAAVELQEAFRINQLRNALLADELVRLLGLLGDAEVPVIPLKGITLGATLYGDMALRVAFDIDLLVPRHEAVRTRRLLLTHGYTSPLNEEFFVDYQLPSLNACSLLPAKRAPCPVDLRWGLLPHSSKDREATEDLWAEARPASILGLRSSSMSPEWEFLFLAVHAASHGWQMLKGLVDIHQISVAGPVDWQKVNEKAGRLGLSRVVEWTFSACSLVLGTPVPSLFVPRRLPARASGERLFPAAPSPAGSWQAGRSQLYLLDRSADKLRWLAAAVFVPSEIEYELLPLPSWLGFLYWPLRLLRLTCKWSWLLLRAGVRRLVRPLRSHRGRSEESA
ncbi:MAG TPA: nucleotidyltransferase family protein [Terriglobia bacterium]|nr:nucleotidyltransferase family protein [Terriglobia bacterium]